MARKSRKGIGSNTQTENTGHYSVGLYARLSVEDLRKKESNSIGTQICLLKQFADKQSDMTVVDVYEDIDQTGTNFERPGFTRLMNDVRKKKVNCIIVKDLSRFGRNYKETGNYLEQVFPFLGVRFISINDNYDSISASSEDNLIIPLKNIINEAYAKDISKKVRSQYSMKRNKGDFCGSFAPYGYIKVGNKLVVDIETAPIVKRIFDLVLSGYSDIAIADMFNNEGIIPPSRHRFIKGIAKDKRSEASKYWYKSVIKRITDNPVYLGQLSQGRYKTDLMNGGGRIAIPEQNWVVVRNAHEPIIDEETFREVQAIKEKRKASYSMMKSDNPPTSENILKGIIYCSDCNRNMIRHKVKRADGSVDYCYLCSTYEETCKNACTKKSIYESKLFALLHKTILCHIGLILDISAIIDNARKSQAFTQKTATIDDEITRVSGKLARIATLRSSLYEDYNDKILTESDYLLAKSKYETEHKALTERLDKLTQEKLSFDTSISTENACISAFNRFADFKQLSRDMVLSLIERIEISNYDDVSITFNYRDEYMALIKFLSESEVAV